MQAARIGITNEGYPIIGLTALSAIVFAIMDCWVMATLFLILCWFSVHFFRDPERVVPSEKNIAVSSADGRVVKMGIAKDPFTGEECTSISIFMNVFNVHVNRAPLDARVEQICYHEGKFFNAAWDKAATDNERCDYRLRDADGELWTVVQIAGLIARRIVCRVEEGDSLKRGERFGMIRFGSRLDFYIPDAYAPCVHVGDTVLAGQSILARKKD